ncbi:hypothetical protein EVAR_23068_1 [Eumeta japonica]|uniref:Homeotic protein proboscipedia n=1 Tax=Eumeta variegata TaxID=151549 RepID=A0A4C1VM54_EUMVA|nr:hypothetical protein EVAR_23068_1 [Eumeta japonica]
MKVSEMNSVRRGADLWSRADGNVPTADAEVETRVEQRAGGRWRQHMQHEIASATPRFRSRAVDVDGGCATGAPTRRTQRPASAGYAPDLPSPGGTLNVPEYPWMKEKKTTRKSSQQGNCAFQRQQQMAIQPLCSGSRSQGFFNEHQITLKYIELWAAAGGGRAARGAGRRHKRRQPRRRPRRRGRVTERNTRHALNKTYEPDHPEFVIRTKRRSSGNKGRMIHHHTSGEMWERDVTSSAPKPYKSDGPGNKAVDISPGDCRAARWPRAAAADRDLTPSSPAPSAAVDARRKP